MREEGTKRTKVWSNGVVERTLARLAGKKEPAATVAPCVFVNCLRQSFEIRSSPRRTSERASDVLGTVRVSQTPISPTEEEEEAAAAMDGDWRARNKMSETDSKLG